MSATKKLNWFLFAWTVGAIMLNGPADRNENMLAITFIFLTVAIINIAAISNGLSTGKISGFLEASIMSGVASWALINLPYNQTWMLWGLALASLGFWLLGLAGHLTTTKTKAAYPAVLKAVAPSTRQYTYPAVPARFSFVDVVGMDDLKAKLRKAGDDVMVLINMGRKSRGKAEAPRNGILLSGDPGNGKLFLPRPWLAT